jgi:hypothetical protein
MMSQKRNACVITMKDGTTGIRKGSNAPPTYARQICHQDGARRG